MLKKVCFKKITHIFFNKWLVWKWELVLNLRYFFAPDNADNESFARQEIEHRIKMSHCDNEKSLLSKALDTWYFYENLFKKYNGHNLNDWS